MARPGTAHYDKATDDMYASFQLPGSRYYVRLIDDQVTGDVGIYPRLDFRRTLVSW